MPVEGGWNAKTGSYNPFAHLRPDSRDFADDAAMIAEAAADDLVARLIEPGKPGMEH